VNMVALAKLGLTASSFIPKALADDPDIKQLFAELDDMDLTMADIEWFFNRFRELVLQARGPMLH
jgi:hypothetical protein